MAVDWLLPSLIFIPLYGFVFLAVGLPWAYALLPRADWADQTTTLGLGLALGPILVTTWLFLIGQFASFDRFLMLSGLLSIAAIGIIITFYRYKNVSQPPFVEVAKLSPIEKTLITMLGLAFIVHIFLTAYFPFIYYDTLWSFGYNARVFVTFNRIPDFIEYYPKLLSLTYSVGQLIIGNINDHIARAAIPWLILSSVIMAYSLGWKVWGNRTVGILTAAFWFLMPQSFGWAFSGDLEHTIAMYFTGATVFFILAWRSHNIRYAVITGLLVGGALWTKPTAGAWLLGLILVVALYAIYSIGSEALYLRLTITNSSSRTSIEMLRQKLKIALVISLTCIPIGGMWYIRNLLLEHPIVRFPLGYWNDFAQRSGKQLTWLIIAALMVALIVIARYLQSGRDKTGMSFRQVVFALIGFILIVFGSVPNALNLESGFTLSDIPEWLTGGRDPRGRMSLIEVSLVVLGLGMIFFYTRPLWRNAGRELWQTTFLLGVIILPFTVTWFWSFSYHPRLMLTIMPVLASFVAVLVNYLLEIILTSKLRIIKQGTILAIICLCLIAPSAMIGYVIKNTLPDGINTDEEKYMLFNPGLITVRNGIEDVFSEAIEQRQQLVIYTFNEYRLPFFFPWMTDVYRWDFPVTLKELQKTPDILIGGQPAELAWQEVEGVYPNQISAYMEQGKIYAETPLMYGEGEIWSPLMMLFAEGKGDPHHLFAYRFNPGSRELTINDVNPSIRLNNAVWSQEIALRGMDIRAAEDYQRVTVTDNQMFIVNAGEHLYLQLYWQRITEQDMLNDYQIVIELIAGDEQVIYREVSAAFAQGTIPSSMLLYPDLTPDRHVWDLPSNIEAGIYSLRIGLLDAEHQNLAPAHVDGDTLDWLTIENVIVIQNSTEANVSPLVEATDWESH